MAGPGLGQRIASFSLHNRAVLPVRFMPPHHPLTALQEGVAAAVAAAAGAAAAADAAERGPQDAATPAKAAAAAHAAAVLQLHAGPAAVLGPAVASAGVLTPGFEGTLQDRLLAYCELYGGLHLADMR